MTNRSKRKDTLNPKPEQIRLLRESHELSQTAAAQLIWSTLRTWQDWEAGIARMHPAMWYAFQTRLRE